MTIKREKLEIPIFIGTVKVAVGVWLLGMSPAVAYARHHPVHDAPDGQAALWIILAFIVLIGVAAWSSRKGKSIRKKKEVAMSCREGL
jgi:hypothetical protein